MVARTLEGEWELENIAVTPERQRKGVGQALMRVLMEIAKLHGADVIFLEVRESNSHARILYERCGFQQSGERKSYYRNPPENAVLYRYLCNPEPLENR
jgi:ribosomal-protein-alanine N-acetyltransferase